MMLSFVKMHGCGNDYLYFDCFHQTVESPETLSVALSDRHFGVGGDGIILVCPSEVADAKMRIFNADGSEGLMCGNGIRCVGKFLYDNHFTDKTTVTIETLSGIKTLNMTVENGKVTRAVVDMGKAILNSEEIPVSFRIEKVVDVPLVVAGKTYRVTCVSMGNPHCVTFMDEIDSLNLEAIGPFFEHHLLFPQRINTEFIRVMDDHTLQMRVWERGSGETFACGTGACAAVVAAVENGYCKKGEAVTVQLKGGALSIRYTDEAVYMEGPAAEAFRGTVDTDLYKERA